MQVFYSSHSASKFCKKGSAVTIGNFDGLHLGHRHLLSQLHAFNRGGLPEMLYTFDPHPVKFLVPRVAPQLINTLDQKIELLSEAGLSGMVIEKFTKPFAALSPTEFFETILLARLRVRLVIVGYDFTFGSRRLGNIETLERLCFEQDVDCHIAKPYLWQKTLVSSSLIRKYIAEGKVHEVIPLLNRPFFLDGKVVRGSGVGKKMGVPTANLQTGHELLPLAGVYATQTRIGKRWYNSLTNLGHKPTLGGKKFCIETHVLGLQQNLYGKTIRVCFLHRLRAEQKFDSLQALQTQIQKDSRQAERFYHAN